jgi:hypothetical protein
MIAICSMVRKPFNFDTWLNYHLSMGVDYIFLRVEDTPELKDLIDRYPNVFAYYDDESNKKNNYFTQMNRQKHLIEYFIPKMEELSIDWLIHIDSDELVCSKSNLKLFFNSISEKYDVVKINNYEAIYDDDSLDNPFYQSNKFKINNLLAYANGKSAVRFKRIDISHTNMKKESNNHGWNGFSPHRFKGEAINPLPSEIVILHFESATYDVWYEKFRNDSDMDKEAFEAIPFDFYRKSIEIIRTGDKEIAREYYNKMKVNVVDDIIKLYWTPQLESKNINWVR